MAGRAVRAERVGFRCARCGEEATRTRATYDRQRARFGAAVWCQGCVSEVWQRGREETALALSYLSWPGIGSAVKHREHRRVLAWREWVKRGWESAEVAITLPLATALQMWQRARAWDVDRGGRFDARAACILVWSGSLVDPDSGAEPSGGFYIYWHTPTDWQATIWKLEWDASEGGSEEEVRRAIALLAGCEVG